MAEWCEERYSVRFDGKDPGGSVVDDPVYIASRLVTASKDPDISMREGGVPLGQVMDSLGYDGDRSGLLDSSRVVDVSVSDGSLRFTVRDNFCGFNVCSALAEKLGVDLDVEVKYRFSDGPGLENESDWQRYRARCRESVCREIESVIGESLKRFSSDGVALPFAVTRPFSRMLVESVGPGHDMVNLVHDGLHFGGAADRMSVRLSDIREVYDLEKLLDYVKENFNEMAGHAVVREAGEGVGNGFGRSTLIDWFWSLGEDVQRSLLSAVAVSPSVLSQDAEFISGMSASDKPVEVFSRLEKETMVRVREVAVGKGIVSGESVTDVDFERENLLQELYGSMSAYQNVSDYMRGFDIVFERKPFVSDEDVPAPYQREDSLRMYYDGELMALLLRAPGSGADQWSLEGTNEAVMDFFRMNTGCDLLGMLGVSAGSPQVSGRRMMNVAADVLLSPDNRSLAREAAVVAARKMRQRDLFRRFNGAKPRPDGLSVVK